MPRATPRPMPRSIPSTSLAAAGRRVATVGVGLLALTCASIAGADAQPPAGYDPGPKAKRAVGWVVAAPCLPEGLAEGVAEGLTDDASSAERAEACPPTANRPSVLEAANGELYVLRGLDVDEYRLLAERPGRPVQLGGTFAWHDRLRTLEVDTIEAVSNTDAEAARTTPPEYQMRQYFMTFLKPGPAQKDVSEERRAELMRGHFGHIEAQAAAGNLLLAGPFGEQTPERRLSGIYLYAVDSLEEAEKLTAQDPSVDAGLFESATIPWYGPASLGY